jgi:DNA (cytosine-5)-methyltransferase 1
MVEQGQTVAIESEAALFSEGDGLHRYKQRAIFTLERICRDIEADGYEVQPILIPACSVGAPHRRDRVFIIGHRIAPDTDLSANVRGSRKDESKSKSKRVQERDQVRQSDQSNQVRSKSPDFSQDTMRSGLIQSESEKQRNVRNVRNAGTRDSERICASSSRSGSSESRTDEIKGSVFADTFGIGWIERIVDHGFSKTPQQKECGVKQPGRANKPQDRWRGFPTVSPIHRGNDGIPFDVDRLSVPFGKWCTESIKAYGNAIVPQVMFEIFRAIEKVEKKKNR